MEEQKIINRIATLKARDRDNDRIVKKLERHLARLRGEK